MSAGFRSAMRVTEFSPVRAIVLPRDAWVTTLVPRGMEISLAIAPSMTYSGVLPPLMVVIPRSDTRAVLPGAPELLLM